MEGGVLQTALDPDAAPPGGDDFRRFSRVAAAGAALLGSLALIGWICGSPALKSILPGLVTMKANTALGLVFSGAALGLLAGRPPRPAWSRVLGGVCAALPALLGLLTLAEYGFDCRLGIDQLLFREPAGAALTTHLGRMAVPTAVEFLLLGAAMLLADRGGARRAAQGLALAAAAVAGVPFAGYAFGWERLFVAGGATPVALHTAAAFILLSAGALSVRLADEQAAWVRRHAVGLGFWAAFFLLAFASVGAFCGVRGLLAANRWVAVTHALLEWNARLLAAVESAEAGSRGFVLTGEPEFLSSYASDGRLARECLRESAAIARDPGSRGELAVMGTLVAKKFAFMDETLALRRRQGRAAGFAAGERRLLEVRTAAVRAEAALTLTFLAGGSLAGLALLGAVFWTLRRESALRRLNEERVLQLNELLARRKLELEAANKELEAFSYSVSHDLRAPLRAMDGFSQALIEEFSDRLPSQGRDYLGRVRAAAQRMARLIDDLLALSRVTRTELRREAVDLSALAWSAGEELSRCEPGRRVDFSVAPGLRAQGDPALLLVVLDNLLGNAWKFTALKPRARVEFGAAESDGQTSYFVRDDGAGFDPAYTGKLFGAFQRLHGSSEFPGTGIGLATVQRIIRRHGGEVWAEGAVGRGATFRFTLPR